MSRAIIAVCVCGLLLGEGLARAEGSRSVGEPRDVVVALYKLAAAKAKVPEVTSPFFEEAARHKYFSKDFDRLIDVAETKAAADGDAFIDFDPVSSSQDAEMKAVSVKSVVDGASKAVVSARFQNHGRPTAVTYDLVLEDGAWKIDDINGTVDKEAWSVRKLLADFDTPSKGAASGK